MAEADEQEQAEGQDDQQEDAPVAGSRITYHQMRLDPKGSIIVEHGPTGSVMPAGVTYVGGGENGWVVDVICVETLTQKEIDDEGGMSPESEPPNNPVPNNGQPA